MTFNLVKNLTLREIRSQYNRTALGRIWSLVNPLAQILVYSLVFGVVFRGQVHEGVNSHINSFALWIASGIMVWSFIAGGIGSGMMSLVNSAGLLTKVYFPREVLVISSVASASVTLATELAVVMVVMAIFGGPLVFAFIPVLIVLIALLAVFVTGLSLLLSVAVVYFRDIQHLWSIFTQVWMYVSGVVFPLTMLQGLADRLVARGIAIDGQPIPLLQIFQLNPAEQFLEAFRAVLYDFTLPSLMQWVSIVLWSAASLLVGWLVFRSKSAKIVEEL